MSEQVRRKLKAALQENACLQAEVERLEPELEQRCRELNLSLAQQAIQLRQIGELKAEVERLRKAGDELQSLAFEYVAETYVPNGRHNRITEAWNEAKEGKQS